MMSSGDDPFIAAFMADYFAECDAHLRAVRGLLRVLAAGFHKHLAKPLPPDDLAAAVRSLIRS